MMVKNTETCSDKKRIKKEYMRVVALDGIYNDLRFQLALIEINVILCIYILIKV
jgi:hypothetical protein